jgi:hypothetical protein
MGVVPIDIGLEVLAPRISEDKAVLAQVHDVKWYSFLDISSGDE